MKKIKLLVVAPNLRISNGITTFLMNNYDYLISNSVIIDFILIKKVETIYNEYVESHGSHIFVFPNDNKYAADNYNYVFNIIKNNNYDIVHINTSGMYAYWSLLAADKNGIFSRIYHSHNPKESINLKSIVREYIFDFLCFKHANYFFACTEHAGKSVFGNREFSVVKNGVQFERFFFNNTYRENMRNELKINDRIVVGTVCRQAMQKNPFFMIDILECLLKYNNKYCLLWVGTGPLLQELKAYVNKKKLSNEVLFIGDYEKIEKCYSAMDCFVLPSKYEGLGLVCIEAQISGLNCYVSNIVPKDTMITKNITYIPLTKSSNEWARIIHTSLNNNDIDRKTMKDHLKDNELSVENTSRILLKEYKKTIGEKE